MAFQSREAVKIEKINFLMRYITAGIQLPIKLSNYINIFNKEFVGELPFNRLGDHAIKINNKNPLYKPLYNLFFLRIRGASPIFK